MTMHKSDSFAALVQRFTGRNADYYARAFDRIANTGGFALTFNLWAGLLGPFWLGARSLWAAFWVVFAVEILAVVLICIGLFGDLGGEAIARADRLAAQAADRMEAAEAAIAEGSTLGESMKSSAEAIAAAAERARAEAEADRARAPAHVLTGAALFLGVRLAVATLANAGLAARFRRWQGNHDLPHGLPAARACFAAGLVLACYPLAVYRFATTNAPDWLTVFPAATEFRNAISVGIDGGVAAIADSFSIFFSGITAVINGALDLMETCLVVTPWPIVMIAILSIALQVSGPRVAIFSGAALAYLAVLGFWEKSMATVALLGTAAFLCVLIGIPVGVWCGRKPRAYAFLRPVLDFMQTMPAFVYLIPVIAFFGIGKPPGIVATLVFGMPPVIRLTALGIAGVPETIREAATSFGASPRFLLFKVDLPLAMPSIMTGINQTLLMCLSMVVIASLIGAKGLGEDVLSALQYAAVGQGILAGLAILMCAMVLDRIVQGRR